MAELRDDYRYTYISTNTTTQVNTGQCRLVRIVLTETAAGAITIYNEIASDTTDIVGVMKASIAENPYDFGCNLSKGLKITTAAASKLTVVWYPLK